MRQHLYIRFLQVFLLFNAVWSYTSAQTMLSHGSKIQEVYTDELGQTLVLDERNAVSLYAGTFSSVIPDNSVDSDDRISSDNKLYYIKDGCLNVLEGKQKKPILCPAPENITGINDHFIWCSDEAYISIYSIEEKLCIDSFPWDGAPILKIIGDDTKLLVLVEDKFIDLCTGLNQGPFPFKATDACIWNNSVLISSRNSGIWVFKNGKFKKLFVPGTMLPRAIQEMELLDESLWIKTTAGELFHFDLDRQILNSVAISLDDLAVDPWNVVHYCSGKRLYTDPGFINKNSPRLLIDQSAINGRSFETVDSLKINQGDILQLRTSTYYPDASRSVVSEYQLNGGIWQNYDADILLSFEEARPYVLSLRCGLDGETMSFVRTFEFDVKQKLKFTLWPYVLAGILILFSFVGLAWWRAESRNSKLEERRKALEMKLSLMSERQKFQQSRMSPHFLFNALNGIKGLVAENENKKARLAIDGFARIMRTILEDSERDRIELSEELKFLEAYLSLEKMVRDGSFEFYIENNISGNIAIPPMMIQPFLENAVIHGISKAEGTGRIGLVFDDAGQYIRVTIEDNGKGLKNTENQDHKSKSVEIFEERAAAIDKWQSQQSIRYEHISGQGSEINGLKCILHIAK